MKRSPEWWAAKHERNKKSLEEGRRISALAEEHGSWEAGMNAFREEQRREAEAWLTDEEPSDEEPNDHLHLR